MRFVKYLFYLTAIIFPLGQLVGLTVPAFPEVRIHLLDILVALTVFVWFVTLLHSAVAKRGKKSQASSFNLLFNRFNRKVNNANNKFNNSNNIAYSFLIFIGVGVVSLLVNIGSYQIHQLIIGSMYLVRFAAYAGFYIVMKDYLNGSLSDRARVKFILIIVGVISGFIGLFQYFLYPNLRNLKYLGWDPHFYRAFGAFLDPQFLGIILVLTLILIINASLFKFEKGSLLRLAVVLVIFITLLLTFSRSSYLALVVSLLSMAVFQRKWKKTVLALVVLVALFAFIPKPSGVAGDLFRRTTVNSRIESWQNALDIWQRRPFFGIGFNMLRYARDSKASSLNVGRFYSSTSEVVSASVSRSGAGVDNSFLFVLATTGIVGLAVYLNIWRLILISFIKKPLIFATAICITVALFIHAMFNNTLFYPWVMWWTWVYFGYLKSFEKT